MTIISSLGTCPSSRHRFAGFAGLAGFAGFIALIWLPITGCGIAKIEPEEIDIADDSESGGLTNGDAEAGSGSADESGNDSQGDGDPNGDGDGDAETGADGDGDGDAETACEAPPPEQVFDGANAIEVFDGPSLLDGTCGGVGPEAAFIYTATVDGVVQFTLSNGTFEGALYLMNELCEEVDCEPAPQILEFDMTSGQTIIIVIDSFMMGGTGSLEITPV